MADSTVKRQIESSEYNNKLKRATAALQQMEQEVRKTGKTFADADKEELAFVQSLGKMQTQATSARGKISELKNAFTELSVQYKSLTDAEKNSPFGKAMQQSLGQLKGRINDLGGQLKDVNSDISGTSGLLDALASKIGIPTELFTKMGVAVAAVGAAAKVATDAFRQNEVLMDEWGRVTESVSSLYDGFLVALNNGDIGGYLTRMNDIVNAARAAYDAMDELGTFNAFNQINKQKARTEFDDAMNNYRGGSGTKEEAEAAKNALIAELTAQKIKEEEAYKAAVLKIASKYKGVNGDELYNLLSTGGYQDYESIKKMMPSKVVTERTTRMDNMGFTHEIENTYTTFANDQEALGAMLRQFTDEHLGQLQAIGAQAQQTAREIEAVERQFLRVGKSGGKSDGGIIQADTILPEGSIAELKQRITELNKALEMVGDQTTRDKIKTQIDDLKSELNEMTNSPLSGQNTQIIPFSVELLDTSKKQLTADVEALRKKLGDPIKLGITTGGSGGVVDTAEATEKAWGAAANAIQSIGGALQQIEDPSAKVAGIVMQAVANIALGFAQATASPATGAAGVFGWIAAATAGIATMVSTIASVKNAVKFADGGMVGGNSYSGDNIVARLNSGEGVLTANGIRNAATMAANANPMSGMQLEALISGESLRLVLANNASRRGGSRGQYAISKFG